MVEADGLGTLRRRSSEKWTAYGDDVLPMFVAEMDFPLAPAIRDALHRAIRDGDTGYANPRDARAAEAFCEYATDTWGWTPEPRRMRYTTDVSVVIVEALRRLIAPGDGVVINPPVYAPFYDLVPEGGGTVVEVPLLDDGTTYGLDVDGIDRALAAGARAVLLCNPHNPVGYVPGRDTLTELARVVDRHGAVVISDEIHAPLVHHGRTFTPYLDVSDEARDHGVTAASGSKAFNLAGLKCALFVAASDRMTDVLRALPREVSFRTGLFGQIATREGFARSRDWLDDALRTVEANVAVLRDALAAHLPDVRLREPDATYLAWLDATALGWGDDPAAVALTDARVAFTSGPTFGQQGRGYLRMNLACSPATITEAVQRLARVHAHR